MITLEKIYQIFLENPVITTDSRNIQKGSLFFALKGENFDGNKFAIDAINQGCIAAIVDDPSLMHDKCIYVHDVLETIQKLATLHRRNLGTRIIAITGTNGKTTTKELVSCVLSKKYKVLATKGNFNNHIGVPLTLLSLTQDIEIAIVEMGANHPNEIEILASIAEPNFGLITNIGRAHLEGFGSFEGVKQTKGELYKYISKSKGHIFYNSLNQHLKDLIGKYNLSENAISYGTGLGKVAIDNSESNGFLGVRVNQTGNSYITIDTSLIGDYNFENVLAAMTIGCYMGIPIERIKEAIEEYTPSNSRSQLVKTTKNTVVLDAYNANPSSMEVAIINFASLKNQNRVVILGEMLELGKFSDSEHKRIAELVESFGFSLIIFIGKGFEHYSKSGLFFINSESCAKYLMDNPIQDSIVLLKGSRGVKLERVLDQL